MKKISGGRMIDRDFIPELLVAIEIGMSEVTWYTKQELIDAVRDAFADLTLRISDDPENDLKTVLAIIEENWQ